MKAMLNQNLHFRPLLLILGILFLSSGMGIAQEKNDNEKSGKQKVNIHITKEIDGVKTVIDTSFTVSEDFDVHHWMEEQDMNPSEPIKSREINKEIKITIPEFAESEIGSLPDTMIINGDTIFLGINGQELKMMFHDFPELADLDIQKYMDESMKDIRTPEFPGSPDCPHFRFEGHPPFPPLHQFMMPGLEFLNDLGTLDNIVIKKKRHGKKIIISFEDRDGEKPIRHGKRDHYYYNDDEHSQKSPKHYEKKVVIRNHDSKVVDENSEVERIKDGDKEIIIIRKK